MHENEFNKVVVKMLKANLERSGFKTLLVAEGDEDVPLATRTIVPIKLKLVCI